jgi:flagellar hook assembly protein FlgD
MKEVGMIGTFSIYDGTGRLIKTLFKNDLLASEGSFSWDGITSEQVKAPIGTYIGILESFDVNRGTTFTKRKTFVVAGKL